MQPPQKIIQMAYVVNDVEEAAKKWIKTAGVGPFFIICHAPVEDILYRGTPSRLDFSGALAQAGNIQIELIQQHDDTPSAYRDMFKQGEEGFHHACVMTNDIDADLAELASNGSPAATEGRFGDMRFAYVDTRQQIGHMLEIIEEKSSILDMFKLVTDASLNWDGRDPIRYL